MDYRFRPIPRWPHRPTAPYQRRSRSTFKAGWQNTLDLLDREVRLLDGQHVLIGGGWSEGHLRQDGMLRANAPAPQHPEAQRDFTRDRGCLVCGTRQTVVDPAHVIDRSVLGEGQDEQLAVVPLCRPHHVAYDNGRLDLLPYLESEGWREHLAFAVARYGLVRTLERVTNVRWTEVAA
jgi:hypothetical protein